MAETTVSFATYCPTLQKEGIVECGHSMPAKEICPFCGQLNGRCNFTMKRISDDVVSQVFNSPLREL